MKIALITSALSPGAGGLSTSVPATAAGLATIDGIQIHVVGTQDPKCPEAALDWGPQVHAHRVIGLPAFHWAPGMHRTLERLSPNITDVQGLWTFPSLANLRYHRRHRKSYIITPHGMLDPWALQRSRWKKRIVSAWFEHNHLHGATCLRATAEMEAEHFRAYGLRQPIAIVPNGVDIPQLSRSADPKSTSRHRILFLSRIHPKKGLAVLLRAWAGLASAHPEWELIIAGPDEVGHEKEMRKLADSLKLPRVQWTGPVHGKAKAQLYASADLFVLPTHAENFGLVIAEALSHGVPVITTRHAPWCGLETHRCGWWIHLTDQDLKAAIQQAIRLPDEERRSMGQRGREWMARDFGWDRVAREMFDVYRWAVYGGKPPRSVHLS